MMRIKRFAPVAVLALLGLALFLAGAGERATAQAQNMLVNPGFEGDYSSYTPETPQEQADCPEGICTTAQIPAGWKPWWVKERPTDVNPEYKPATSDVGGNRVRSGSRASQYFSFWTTHKAGLRQTVNVPANAIVEFSVWGHSWMSEEDAPLVSDRSGTPNMRVGIDPTGGTNPYSPAIVWSDYQQAYDVYQRFSVQAAAQGERVTVFTFAAPSVNPNSPEYGFKHTDMYWDDAALIVVGQSFSAPPPATPVPDESVDTSPSEPAAAPVVAVPFVPGPTPTPNAEGIILSEALPGDSLWSLSARAGITLDEILEYNDLSRSDIISPGDMLIVGYGDPPGDESASAETSSVVSETVEFSSAVTETIELAAADVGSTEEEALAAGGARPDGEDQTQSSVLTTAPNSETIGQLEPESEGAVTVCLAAFDDANRNASHDAGEELRESVAFTISDGQKVVTNYITDGESEPFCVRGLEAGTYRISRSTRRGEVLTTAGDHSVSLTEGSNITLEFGSVMEDTAVAKAASGVDLENQNTADEDAATEDGNAGLLVVAVVVALALLIGVLIIILTARRSVA